MSTASPPSSSLQVAVRRAVVEEIVDLRHAELRRGQPRETAYFAGDDAPETRHYAALAGDLVVGCASFVRASLPERWPDAPALQLRGMATRSDLVGRGVGRTLLDAATADLYADGEARLWCNARVSARGFYERLGWRVISPPFDVVAIGPHVKMIAGLGRREEPQDPKVPDPKVHS
jgi:GNAT superfamily N-acetyltransferase